MKSLVRIAIVASLPLLALAAALWVRPGAYGVQAGSIPAELAGAQATAEAGGDDDSGGAGQVNQNLPFAPSALVYPAVGVAGVAGAYALRRRRSNA
jgi:hypothetical protein